MCSDGSCVILHQSVAISVRAGHGTPCPFSFKLAGKTVRRNLHWADSSAAARKKIVSPRRERLCQKPDREGGQQSRRSSMHQSNCSPPIFLTQSACECCPPSRSGFRHALWRRGLQILFVLAFDLTNFLRDINQLSLKACRRDFQVPGLDAPVEFAGLGAK